jgi:hypothetical protein
MKINKDSRTALLSTLLGDGYLDPSGYVDILQCEAQKDFLEWKRNFLISNNISCNEIKFKDNNGFPAWKFTTKCYKFGKLYRRILYSPSKKVANRKLLNRFEPIHLAIWYMDDGGLSQKKKNGAIVANELMINTHLTKEENQIIIDYFKEVWNVSFSQVLNRGKYRLRCGTAEARKFLNIVREYVQQVPSMAHKLNVKSSLSRKGVENSVLEAPRALEIGS